MSVVSQSQTSDPEVLIRRMGFSSRGLRLKPGMKFDEWCRVLKRIASFGNATQWAYGDAWFYGEWEYGAMYETAAELTGLTPQALADLKYVAGRFEFSRRRENLSLSHHREVAPLSPEEQDRWLDLCEEHGWSREKLRQALSGQLELGEEEIELPPARAKKVAITAPSAPLQETRLVEVPDEVLGWTDWSEPVQIRVAGDGPRLGLQVRAILSA
jgi:hypothetical protein